MSADASDLSLVRRVQRGDKGAFDALVLKYQHKLVKLVMRYVRNPAEAEDIAQEAFIKAYRALPQFRGDSAFYTWLYRIAINTAKNAVVSRDRRRGPPALALPPRHEGAGLSAGALRSGAIRVRLRRRKAHRTRQRMSYVCPLPRASGPVAGGLPDRRRRTAGTGIRGAGAVDHRDFPLKGARNGAGRGRLSPNSSRLARTGTAGSCAGAGTRLLASARHRDLGHRAVRTPPGNRPGELNFHASSGSIQAVARRPS